MTRRRVIVALLLSYTSAFCPFVSSTSGFIGLIGSKKPRFQSKAYTRSILTMRLNLKSLQRSALMKLKHNNSRIQLKDARDNVSGWIAGVAAQKLWEAVHLDVETQLK